MKPYEDLTAAGKLRRLRNLATVAVEQYELARPQISFYTFATNLLYRVSTLTGEQFMLRLASPGWRTYQDLFSEALWLEALGRDTDIPVPRIFPARSGERVLQVRYPGIPKVWNATLMSWVPGRLLGHYLTARNLEKMGRLFAQLHHHGASWDPPQGFTTRRFEHWLSRGEENLIVRDPGSSNIPDHGDRRVELTSQHRDIIERMHLMVEKAYAAIDRSDLRVIHCDLWHDNIKIYRGALHPIDFEDTVWGFRAHDIAMAMLDLLEVTKEERYNELVASFRRGYEDDLPWPDDSIEPFQIGRMLWKINWVARFQPQHLESMIDRHVPVFDHYERTGQVILPASG